MEFGIPKRGQKTEKYDFGVFTLESMPIEKGKGFRMNLNKAGVELMEIDTGLYDSVSFSFKELPNKKIEVLLINSTGCTEISANDKYVVGKNLAFSNQRIMKYLYKITQCNESIDNAFHLLPTNETGCGKPVFRLELLEDDLVSFESPSADVLIEEEELPVVIETVANLVTDGLVQEA